MPHDETRKRPNIGPHHLSLQNRSKLAISGVEDVESFDENTICLLTTEGGLTVRGSELHIEKLSLDGGDLLVEGKVESLSYEEDNRRQGGLFGRLFHT